ncbi:MAG: DUF4910 domain-containing protein [Bacteroidetes bacterium]|nr:DUF4910 domain-containing protein [Bacteroidota bacterium]
MNKEIEKYFDRLWPICRSITGNGLRDSLKIISEIIPLQLKEVPTGKKVFDWEIPKEWNISDAWILGPDGKKYAELKKNNLHVVNYSVPVDAEISFDELKDHLHILPNAIPYVTSYYKETWGFCMSEKEFSEMPKNGKFKVKIDSELKNGSLTFGEAVIPGTSDREILISTYVCHPSMAVNELSGPLVAAFLYKRLISENKKSRHTIRFVFAPETIGVIAFLAERGMHLKEKLDAGYVVTCVGHAGKLNYKRSKRGNSIADKTAEHVLKYSGEEFDLRDFSIGGSDERQYCSAGFNFPVGSLMRTPYKEYSEYHSSLDNKSIIDFSAMEKTISVYAEIIDAIGANQKYTVTQPYCELQLGKRGMYPQQGGNSQLAQQTRDLLHLLSYADGTIDLIDIAEKIRVPVSQLIPIVENCLAKDLLRGEK